MLKLSKFLFFYGMIVGLIGTPVAFLGLIIKVITGSWTMSHIGLCMMAGGLVAFIIGIVIMNYVARKMITRDLERFMRQHQQSEQIIDVEQLPPPTALGN